MWMSSSGVSGPLPYRLGLAWGEGLVANPQSEVMLATPDTMTDAIASTVH